MHEEEPGCAVEGCLRPPRYPLDAPRYCCWHVVEWQREERAKANRDTGPNQEQEK